MEATINLVNGVDLNRLGQTIKAVQEDPELAVFRFHIKNKWIDCGYNQTEIKNFYSTKQVIERNEPFIVANDEPDVLLGQDSAPNPVENLLHALAGCLTTSMVYHGAAKGYEIEQVSSRLEGELDLRGFLGIDPTVRAGYKNIRVCFKIDGNLSEEEKQDILELTKFSPVFDMVSNKVPVMLSLENEIAEIDC